MGVDMTWEKVYNFIFRTNRCFHKGMIPILTDGTKIFDGEQYPVDECSGNYICQKCGAYLYWYSDYVNWEDGSKLTTCSTPQRAIIDKKLESGQYYMTRKH